MNIRTHNTQANGTKRTTARLLLCLIITATLALSAFPAEVYATQSAASEAQTAKSSESEAKTADPVTLSAKSEGQTSSMSKVQDMSGMTLVFIFDGPPEQSLFQYVFTIAPMPKEMQPKTRFKLTGALSDAPPPA